MGKREGSIAIARIENDLSRLELSLKRTKHNKIRFLLEHNRQRGRKCP